MSIKVLIISVLGVMCIGAIPSYEEVRFSTYIVQNGKRLEVNQHVVEVKRSSFEIVFDMPDSEGVFVNTSFNPKTYQQVLSNIAVKNIQGFKSTAMAEMWRNPNGELLVSDNKPSFWFIDSAKKHRFSSYHKVNERFLCERHVDVLYDVDNHKGITLSSVIQPLYLSFIKYIPNSEGTRGREMMRHELKIVWVD